MAHIVAFYAIQLAACWYAFRRGGGPEWLVAGLLLTAALATTANGVLRTPTFGHVDPIRLVIDLTLLLGIGTVALTANRYWPLWLSALHLLGVAVHGVRAYQPELVPWIYAVATGKIAYPMILLLGIGTWRHRRRVATFGSDPDWSFFHGR